MFDFTHPMWSAFWLMLGLAVFFLAAAVAIAVLWLRSTARREHASSRDALEALALEIARTNEATGKIFVEAVVREAKGVFANFDYMKFTLEENRASLDRLASDMGKQNGILAQLQADMETIALDVAQKAVQKEPDGFSMAPDRQPVLAEVQADPYNQDIRLLHQELGKALPHLEKLSARSESLDQLLRSTARSLGKLKISML